MTQPQKEMPQDMKRGYQRWWWLFFGVWDALHNLNPGIRIALGKELDRVGLGGDGMLNLSALDAVPSRAVVDKTRRFYQAALGLNQITGKTRRRIPPWYALALYDLTYREIKKLPRRRYVTPRSIQRGPFSPNPAQRYWDLEQCLQRIEHDPFPKPQRFPTKGQLNKWKGLSGRQLANRIVAHMLGISTGSLKKILAEARKRATLAQGSIVETPKPVQSP